MRFTQPIVPNVPSATYPSVSTEATEINVTNPNAAHSDNLRLFFAGAVVAIAGGALLTAVEAIFEPIRKRAVRSYNALT